MGRPLKRHLDAWKLDQAVGDWKGPAFFPRGKRREQEMSMTHLKFYPGRSVGHEPLWVMASMTCLWNGTRLSE